MDLAAYDLLQETAVTSDNDKTENQQGQSTLNNDLQDAYKAFSSSPWGAKIGGFFGNVVKQGESVYNQASKELAEVGEDATKGFNDLRESIMYRTRSLSLNAEPADGDQVEGETKAKDGAEQSENVLSRLRSEATKRLKDLQKAEDAADEVLLKFGANVRDFLRDAISVAPPDASEGSTVLFESKDADGKRVIHASRFDAQLYVIHTSTDSFKEAPTGDEFTKWAETFDIDSKTDDISADLEKHPDLRATMEKLVPDQVPYAEFWKRYYFMRHGIEAAEARRRDLLKAAAEDDDVGGWGDDSEDEEVAGSSKKAGSIASSTTIHPPASKLTASVPQQPLDTKSQPDSEASYDVVGTQSGLPSQAATSPKETKKDDESDDDWE